MSKPEKVTFIHKSWIVEYNPPYGDLSFQILQAISESGDVLVPADMLPNFFDEITEAVMLDITRLKGVKTTFVENWKVFYSTNDKGHLPKYQTVRIQNTNAPIEVLNTEEIAPPLAKQIYNHLHDMATTDEIGERDNKLDRSKMGLYQIKLTDHGRHQIPHVL